MDVIIRGNVVEFSTQFFDAAGAAVTPSSVLLTIRVASVTPVDDVEIAMSPSGSTWTATWDTTDVVPGIVYWEVQATSPNAADQGYFQLSANWANA